MKQSGTADKGSVGTLMLWWGGLEPKREGYNCSNSFRRRVEKRSRSGGTEDGSRERNSKKVWM